eukprot:Nitzschia sp. Nitz4//scaffold1_size375055//71516//73939//NITZ4_000228-RA/size375055-processed-gene-0.417-mRNA-1//-1//CDS//3329540901//4716//frame0
MSSRSWLQKPSTARILAVGGATICTGSLVATRESTELKFAGSDSQGYGRFHRFYQTSLKSLLGNSSVLAPNVSLTEAAAETPSNLLDRPAETKEYDFVVIGNGNAGQSTVKTLRERCPRAKIAVVDPFRTNGIQAKSKVELFKDTVTNFDPKTRKVWLMNDQKTEIKYKHGILVATGSRGAPPPMELFEPSSLSRILELRTTEVMGNTKRPVMAPDQVRAAVVNTSAAGGKVAILGSGWEALDLLGAAEAAGRRKPVIAFGSAGPAWNILPQYLSTEFRKKLLKRDIEILDRSIVRYIAEAPQVKSKRLEMHTAKVYDLLETKRTLANLIVLAPDSFGTKGTAALPTKEVPDHMKETWDGRPWYQTWSQLSKPSEYTPSVVACFDDDGRVSVNAELCVASRIYAAGSVAKYPNSTTGQATVAGEGRLNGSEAGRVAAINMSREYLASQAKFSNQFPDEVENFASCSLPVWRSDTTSYSGQTGHVVTSLSRLGVQALCVGNCDSERLNTRGFWWTNASAHRKVVKVLDDGDSSNSESNPMNLFRLARRRMSKQRKSMGSVAPIYGIGVVFYLDSNGLIRGVMTWGLPFADAEGGNLNPHLLHALQRAVLTNVGISALDAEEKHQLMNAAMAKQSQKFVAMALDRGLVDATASWHGLDGAIEAFAKPLYRYTEVDAVNNVTMRVLKRKDGGGMGVLGEDMYARDELAIDHNERHDASEATPTNIPDTNYPVKMVPVHAENGQARAASIKSVEELNLFLASQRGWEENENRARPGKEDLLWLRPGDERRNTSRKQVIIEAYKSIMFPHRQ